MKPSRYRKFLDGNENENQSTTGGGLFDRKLLRVLRQLFEGYHKGTDTNIQIKLLQTVRGVLRAAHIIGPHCLISTQDQVATELAVSLARHPLRSHIAAVRTETLEVLRAVVHGGNATAQRVMTAYFLSTRDEKFFVIVDSVLANARQSILERESLMMQKAEADAFQLQMRDELGPEYRKFVSIDLTEFDKKPVSHQVEQLYKMWDFAEAELTLEILQLFCEGHNTFLQNYIRTQEDNYGSGKNLVWATTELLSIATAAVVSNSAAFSETMEETHADDNVDGGTSTTSSMRLVTEILEFLNESAGGNLKNTEVIGNSKALDNVVVLLAHTRKLKDSQQRDANKKPRKPTSERDWVNPEDNSIFAEDVVALDVACANLLRTFLESNAPFNREIMWKVSKAVDVSVIFYQIAAYYGAGEDEAKEYLASLKYSNRHSVEADIKSKEVAQRYKSPAFTFYTIVARLQDLTGANYSNEQLDANTPTSDLIVSDLKTAAGTGSRWKAWFFQHVIAPIEVALGRSALLKSAVDTMPRPVQVNHYAAIEKQTASVELWVDDTLQKVYFYRDPELLKLFIGPENGALRNRQLRELDWTNNQGKDRAENFIICCRKIIADHRRINAFWKRSRLTKYLIDSSPFFRNVTYALAWVINFLMVCFWAAKDGDFPYEGWNYVVKPLVPVFTSGGSWMHSALLTFAVLHVLFSWLLCISFFLRKPPTAFVWKEDAWFPSFTLMSGTAKRSANGFNEPQLKLIKDIGVDLETELHDLTSTKLQDKWNERFKKGTPGKVERELKDGMMDILIEQDKAAELESQVNSGVDVASSGAINVLRKLMVSPLIPDSDATERQILNGAFLYRLAFFLLSVFGK